MRALRAMPQSISSTCSRRKGGKTGSQLRRDSLVGYRYFVIPVGRLPMEDQLHMDKAAVALQGFPGQCGIAEADLLGFLGFAQKPSVDQHELLLLGAQAQFKGDSTASLLGNYHSIRQIVPICDENEPLQLGRLGADLFQKLPAALVL